MIGFYGIYSAEIVVAGHFALLNFLFYVLNPVRQLPFTKCIALFYVLGGITLITASIFSVFGCLYLEQPADSPDHWKGKYIVTFCVLSGL